MISFMAFVGSAAGTLAALLIVGICVVASGSWWPLAVLLVIVVIAWMLPWEIFRERRQKRQASAL